MNSELYLSAARIAEEIIEKAGLQKGQVLVVGCSTSEILGSRIGTFSSPDAANEVFHGLYDTLRAKGIFLAAQCCEHLNRAIITERACRPYADTVNVLPMPKAGGSFATAAYNAFEEPVVLEEISADAGIDIGFTLIGMHLKRVAVPVRLENDRLGDATVLAARTRPKFIGGARAVYNEQLL